MKIIETKGDVLKSNAELILHQTNCIGIMGGGLAKQVKELYPHVYKEYRDLCNSVKTSRDLLGEVQYCHMNECSMIGNVFGQDGVGHGSCQTDYDALKHAFNNVAEYVKEVKFKKVAIPKYFGCGLAGGDWNIVKGIITEAFNDLDIELEIVEFNNN